MGRERERERENERAIGAGLERLDEEQKQYIGGSVWKRGHVVDGGERRNKGEYVDIR